MSAPADALARARAHSPFLAGLIDSHPELVELIGQGQWDAALERALAPLSGTLAEQLRRERAGVALVVALADLAGAWDLGRVTRTLSDFADDACDRALACAIRERAPDAAPGGFAVVALGKLGGRELNYSSDIDPLLIYDPDRLPRRRSEEPQEAAVRIARRFVALLSEQTALGRVFRVDLRLRPTPEVSPIALPLGGAIAHYESSALGWEQAAFIRARACAGDRLLGQLFLDAIAPFVWRRSLDFGQIDNIARVSAAIRDHHSRGQCFGPGFDVKRGRGGIRECEFFAQALQLIHGGRDPLLRVADTRAALHALAEAELIERAEAEALSHAYTLLRTLEHRLQMVADRQTHRIPVEAAALDGVARLHGVGDGPALLAWAGPAVEQVACRYDRLLQSSATGDEQVPAADTRDWLSAAGFAQPEDVARRLGHWRSGALRSLRSDAALEAFERVLPTLLRSFSRAPDPGRAIARFDRLLERVPSAVNIFRLLEARPGLLSLLADVLSHAPVLADALADRVELLDGLLDASALELPGSVEELSAGLGRSARDYQQLLDLIRWRVGEQRFALGCQLLQGPHDPLEIAAGYARVAEAAIAVSAQATVQAFAEAHGRVPGSELVVVALGRLGGGAMTHASDLDLVFLFTGDHAAVSDGSRPLGGTRYFNRLAARIVTALSAPTAAGPLYAVDTRLRPSGQDGLLAVSLAGFDRYQRENAWTWEHMALTRARPVFGSEAACAQVKQSIAAILGSPRDVSALTTDVLAMRRDLDRHRPPAGPLDVKRLPGGLIDCEFLAHHVQLADAVGVVPSLEGALQAQVDAGLWPARLIEAYRFQARLLMLARLVAPEGQDPPPATRELLARRLEVDGWPALLARLSGARAEVRQCWRDRFGEDRDER